MKTKIAAMLVVAGCTATTPPASENVEPEPTPEPRPVAVAPKVAPSPKVAPAERASAFHRVAELPAVQDESDPHFRLFTAGDTLLASAGPVAIPIGSDGSFTYDPSAVAGLVSPQEGTGDMTLFGVAMWDVIAAGGRWPDAFYATVAVEWGFRGAESPKWVYRKEGDRWVDVANTSKHFTWFVADAAEWKDGSVLALKGFEPIHVYPRNRDETAEPTKASVRAAAAAIAKQRPLVVIRGAGKAPDLGRRDIAAIDALDSGEIIGVVEGETPVAVHYDPMGGAVTERPLPRGKLVDADVLLEAPSRAWIFGRSENPEAPYLARFDGEAWREEPMPPCGENGLSSYSRTPEGDAWAICGYAADVPLFGNESNSLWQREAEAATWVAVRLPDGAIASEVVARGRDDVWLAGNALWHTRPRSSVAKLPGYTGMWLDILEYGDAVEPFGCNHGTTLVSGSPSGAHEDLAAALSREFAGKEGALSLVEVAFRGEQRLALQYHVLDDRTAAARARRALGDRMLDTFCLFREPTREIWSL